MTVTISQTQSNNMADSLNTDIGTAHKLILFTSGDAELATMTYAAASATVGTVSGAEALTYSEASYTDEASGNAGTVSYAVIQTSGSAEVVRFTDPSTELSLSSLVIGAGDAVNVTDDVVVKLPQST
ncbi:MAG: hypothetical protein GY941_15780 [Planctomycetes bacterium]|nr:hypothetical protein [Planctomycetota bacterium]